MCAAVGNTDCLDDPILGVSSEVIGAFDGVGDHFEVAIGMP